MFENNIGFQTWAKGYTFFSFFFVCSKEHFSIFFVQHLGGELREIVPFILRTALKRCFLLII
jgi:hypothetical protein